jgi:hypothetical protein
MLSFLMWIKAWVMGGCPATGPANIMAIDTTEGSAEQDSLFMIVIL